MMHTLKHTDQSEIVMVGSETTTTGLLASRPPTPIILTYSLG